MNVLEGKYCRTVLMYEFNGIQFVVNVGRIFGCQEACADFHVFFVKPLKSRCREVNLLVPRFQYREVLVNF